VRTARTALVPRAELTGPDGAAALERRGFVFPLLLRSPGFHTGQHFEYVAAGRELAVAAGALPGELHLAIGRQWKVHYFSAEMAERPDYREREQRYLDDMAGTLGPAATNALASVGAALALDYAGIDFGFTPSGELVVFEANATMVVVPPAADERWEYRRAAIARVGDAVRGMLIGRAALPR